MPRPRTHKKQDLIVAAMHRFWTHGYSATSMDDLVKFTGVSRHGIYSDVGGKHALHLESLSAYQEAVVSPAFAKVEENGAGLSELKDYFETQITLAENMGLPGPGCLIANTSTETAPHDPEVMHYVEMHNQRLEDGFKNVIRNSAPQLTETQTSELAQFVVLVTQGLWSLSRVVGSAEPLKRHVETLIQLLSMRFQND